MTVLIHELAHQLGGSDLDSADHPDHLLAGSLGANQRRLPGRDLDELFSDPSFLH